MPTKESAPPFTHDKKEKLTGEMKVNITDMFVLIEKAMDTMIINLNKHNYEVDITASEAIEKRINRLRDKLRKQHVKDIENEKYSYQIGTLYKDIFSESEKMGDYIYDVTESIIDYADS